jgi:uncharacterized repeat protein (TIGR03803 family)
VLYSFHGGSDGWLPRSGLTLDSAGNFYGTTEAGGSANSGTIFELASDGTESVLYSFQGGNDGVDPISGVIMDKTGDLYGTTFLGGSNDCDQSGCGIAFELTPAGTETILYAFGAPPNGQQPAAALLMGKHDVLYGTTTSGGQGDHGIVFKLTTK